MVVDPPTIEAWLQANPEALNLPQARLQLSQIGKHAAKIVDLNKILNFWSSLKAIAYPDDPLEVSEAARVTHTLEQRLHPSTSHRPR